MTAPGDPGEPLVKDMAATWPDILRLLPVALRGWDYQIEGTTVEVGSTERGATVAVEPLPPRGFGPVQISRSRVAFEFRGLEPGEREAFTSQFDRAFQRGGG